MRVGQSIAIVVALTLALSGCGGGSSASTELSNPTTNDAFKALVDIMRNGPRTIVYGPGGPVSDCTEGRDASGRVVRSCNVCEIVLVSGRDGLQIERSIFNLAFRRAVSRAQPDIAPMDESGGVWVGVPTDVGAIERAPMIRRPLTTDDVRPLGLTIPDNETVCLPPSPGQVLGFCVRPDSDQVINILASDVANSRMRELVGSCQ